MKKIYADYLLKKTKEDYDKIAKDFSDSRYSIWEEFSIFKDYIKDNDRILDLGCGNGRLIDLFKDKNIEYVGVDNSEKLIRMARDKFKIQNSKFKIQFMVADALNLPFEDNSFNKIFSIAVLHHIPSEEYRLQFLKEAKRVLKPGGFLILTVWNLWKRPSQLKIIFKFTILKIFRKLDFKDVFISFRGKIDRYIHCFTKRELKNLAKMAGLKIEKIGIFRRGETPHQSLRHGTGQTPHQSFRHGTGQAQNFNIYLIAQK